MIELKRDAVPAVVLNNLFLKTGLQTTFSGNFLALIKDGTSPGRFTLKEALEEFRDFRFDVVRRRANNRLVEATERDQIVVGLLKALQRIDDIIEVIRQEPDRAGAKGRLAEFNLTETQVT